MCANNTELAKCFSGVLNGSKCHKNDFTQRSCLFKAEEIERGKLRLIKWRSGFCHLNTICHIIKLNTFKDLKRTKCIAVIHLEDIPSSSEVSLFYCILFCYNPHEKIKQCLTNIFRT